GVQCHPHEVCEECPEWIFTLADLIMCMMGLFVILWVLKPSPQPTPEVPDEWVKTAAAIREAFGYLPDPDKLDDPVNAFLLKKIEQQRNRLDPGDGGEINLEIRGIPGADPETTSIRPGAFATEGGKLLFEPGSTDLSPEVQRELDIVITRIKGHRNIVMVKGHSGLDDLAESATPQQRMELSLQRAQAVADYLTRGGVGPDIRPVQRCSTFEPVVLRAYTPEARALNRRVEVDATSTLVNDLRDQPNSPKALLDQRHSAPRDIAPRDSSASTDASAINE